MKNSREKVWNRLAAMSHKGPDVLSPFCILTRTFHLPYRGEPAGYPKRGDEQRREGVVEKGQRMKRKKIKVMEGSASFSEAIKTRGKQKLQM